MKKVSWLPVACIDDLEHLEGKKCLLVGNMAYASSRDVHIPGYMKLPPRTGAGPIKARLVKKPTTIFVGVREDIASRLPNHTRVGLAIDAYIRWGIRSTGKTIIIGGYGTDSSTSLDILIFESGAFVAYENKLLPSQGDSRYQAAVADLIDDYRTSHPEHRVVQAAPLERFGENYPNIEYLGEQIFAKIRYTKLHRQGSGTWRAMRIPVGIVVLIGAFYAGAVASAWNDYAGAKAAFDREINDPILTSRGGIDTSLVDVIVQRKNFMAEPRAQTSMSEMLQTMASNIAQLPGLRILDITVTDQDEAEQVQNQQKMESGKATSRAAPKITMTVAVAKGGGSALEQSRSVLEAIADKSGMTVRLARPGWSEESTQRKFVIEVVKNG